MTDLVECHSGYEYAVRPTALQWQGERMVVAEILESWRNPGVKCFRVRTVDEQIFILCYDERRDEWRVDQP
jgi:hypothetical protein